MTLTSMGRINVPTPGTPVRLSTDNTARCGKLLFQVAPGNTGRAYVGTSTMNKSTYAGVARALVANAAGVTDQFFLETADGADTINLFEYAIDMDNSTDGVLVSYWTE